MIKVYTPPTRIKAPNFSEIAKMKGKISDNIRKADKKYYKEIVDFCKKNGKGKFKGEEVQFQVADGYATYFVFSDSPMVLIHDESGDAYHYMYIERLTKKDILDQIKLNKYLEN